MNSTLVWIQIAQIASTTVIGLIVAFIAYQQWRTNHQKVILDMFDRRYKIYENTKEFIRLVRSKRGRISQEECKSFHSVRNDAHFLFGIDVAEYLKDLHDQVIDLSLRQDLSLEDQHDLEKRLNRTIETRPTCFDRYLKMDQVSVK